jgi:hypothetical protein
MELLDLWVAQEKEKAEWPGWSEAWQRKADTLMRRRGGVVEARDGTLFSFEPPTVPVIVVGNEVE